MGNRNLLDKLMFWSVPASLLLVVQTSGDSSGDQGRKYLLIWVFYALGYFFIYVCLIGLIREGLHRRRTDHQWDPNRWYCESVQKYYDSTTDHYQDTHDIQLPSPFMYQYDRNKAIWDKPGYWQDEWRSLGQSDPSVYNGAIPLPPPYTGRHSWREPEVWFADSRKMKRRVS